MGWREELPLPVSLSPLHAALGQEDSQLVMMVATSWGSSSPGELEEVWAWQEEG